MTASRHFTNESTSVHEARSFVEDCLGEVGREDLDVLVLMVSELATNSVRYGGSTYEVGVSRSDRLVHVAVTDQGSGRPAMQDPPSHVASGRGLRIVDALAGDWGIEDRPDGRTSVWFSFTTDGGAAESTDRGQVAI